MKRFTNFGLGLRGRLVFFVGLEFLGGHRDSGDIFAGNLNCAIALLKC